MTDEVFEIDASALRMTTLKTIFDADAAAKQYRIVTAYAYSFALRAISADNRAACNSFIDFAIDTAGKGKDQKLADRLQQRKALFDAEIAFSEGQEKLRSNPSDPAANLVVGKHTCLESGDWQGGLRMLAQCNDAKWKEVAELELAPPSTPDDMVTLAARLYDLAASERGWVRDAILLHASDWYRKAIPNLKGLKYAIAKATAESRLAEIKRVDLKPTPPAVQGLLFDPDCAVYGSLRCKPLGGIARAKGATRATEAQLGPHYIG